MQGTSRGTPATALPTGAWTSGARMDRATERDSFLSAILSVAAAANCVTIKHLDGRFWLESPLATFAVAPSMGAAGQQRTSDAAQRRSATNTSGKPSSKSAAKRKRDGDRWNKHFKPSVNPVASSSKPAQPASDEQQGSQVELDFSATDAACDMAACHAAAALATSAIASAMEATTAMDMEAATANDTATAPPPVTASVLPPPTRPPGLAPRRVNFDPFATPPASPARSAHGTPESSASAPPELPRQPPVPASLAPPSTAPLRTPDTSPARSSWGDSDDDEPSTLPQSSGTYVSPGRAGHRPIGGGRARLTSNPHLVLGLVMALCTTTAGVSTTSGLAAGPTVGTAMASAPALDLAVSPTVGTIMASAPSLGPAVSPIDGATTASAPSLDPAVSPTDGTITLAAAPTAAAHITDVLAFSSIQNPYAQWARPSTSTDGACQPTLEVTLIPEQPLPPPPPSPSPLPISLPYTALAIASSPLLLLPPFRSLRRRRLRYAAATAIQANNDHDLVHDSDSSPDGTDDEDDVDDAHLSLGHA